MLRRSFDVLEPMFLNHIVGSNGMGLLSDQESWVKVLKTLPEAARTAGIAASLDKEWAGGSSPSEGEKWADIKAKIAAFVSKSRSAKAHQNASPKERDQIEMWP